MTLDRLAVFAESDVRTTFEWGRIQSNSDWILPIAACVVIMLFVRWLYRRDAVELSPIVSWLLTLLRTAAFFGLLVMYLQPHWRSEREVTRNSRVLLLVDASLSMGLTDGEVGQASAPVSRSRQVISALSNTDFIARLRKVHDVIVVPFSENLARDHIITLEKQVSVGDGDRNLPSPDGRGAGGEGSNSLSTLHSPLSTLLAPTGSETRLGQSLRQLIQDERGSPVSAVILISDGGQNAGISPGAAVELAQEAKIPVFTVGLGSDRQPTNVAICDLAVPARAYPGDRYTVTGYVQAQGMAGKTASVQLLSRQAGDGASNSRQGAGEIVETREITLGGDGEVLPVKFQIMPDGPGRKTLCFRIVAPAGDRNPADNLREADVEIVDRKNHILLFAGGPMREYHFLRNQLYRDHSTTVDVFLQSGRHGMSQDAKKVLENFPSTREEMFDYDCLVAFDPNWQALDAGQVELVEKWVGEQGGGLIAIAGSVYACKGVGGWTQDSRMTPIKNLYPVEFPSRLVSLENNAYASKEPWPLDFTRDGQESDFLWPADTAAAARQAWANFHGVYGFCPVRGAKPGATVFARFSDPRAAQGGQQPVYFAGQFYGSGNVFYMGSGEMWRLRAVEESYFEQFYTKLIRHVSQGRLLRGSNRGVLLVGQDRYMLGNTVDVRAQLTDVRLEPLKAPSVPLQIVQPDGTIQTVHMRPDTSRAGAFFGQFPALQEGTYRLELTVPDSDNQQLTRRIQVKVPDLERENPRRNDALMSSIAKNTGGKYYVGMSRAVETGRRDALTEQLKDQTSTVILTATPNPEWEENWLRGLMVFICAVLCLEWLLRRLMKLA